jgi:Holliday junction resolvase-like predicted endonuclease
MLKSLLGQTAESHAAAFLESHGLKLVARNWRCRFGEIDLVMQTGPSWCSSRCGCARAAISAVPPPA